MTQATGFLIEKKKDIVLGRITEKRATVDISAAFKDELIAHIDEGNSKVIIDLSDTEFVDSSFLGALVAGLKKATMNGGDLKIFGLRPPVRAMFELTRLYRIFDIFDDEKSALESF